jgi:hypothetical protein
MTTNLTATSQLKRNDAVLERYSLAKRKSAKLRPW